MIQALKTVIPVRRQVQAVIRRYYRPKASKAQAPAVLSSVLEDRRSRAKSRLMTWFLEDEGTPDGEFHWFSKETLLAASGVSQATLKAAVKEGLVEESRPAGVPSAAETTIRDLQEKSGLQMFKKKLRTILWRTAAGASSFWRDRQRKTEVYMELMAR